MTKKVIKKVKVKVAGSAPDVDTDFHTEGRAKVIEYVANKYGRENVANIATFGKFKAKTSFKSMATIYGAPFVMANRISAAIPNPIDGVECSLEELYDPMSPRYGEGEDFRRLTEETKWKNLVKAAMPLDGRIRNTGTHACGLVIGNHPLNETIPTQIRQSDEALITQWTYPQCESLGLIKMDFLGLDTIDVIENTLENIQNNGKKVPDMVELVRGPMNDEKTFAMLQRGETTGIFQLGGAGVKDLLIRAQPDEFMDIATITALYRPGPMSTQSHLEWADRKNGSKKVIYLDKEFSGTVIEEILKETAGILVFQEQIMQIATDYAGMTPYESEQLRKAMGKKKMAVMMSMRPKFINGAIENGSTERLATLLWDTMVGFAQYGFNKSHSVSYAINAYKTCYLKAHYPSEFMAALLQQNINEPSKISIYLQEAQDMGLKIGPVNINESFGKISASNNSEYDIVYGFSGVKQVNGVISEEIVKERLENGKYSSVSDFLKRITKVTTLNSQALKYLANAGAFDCFEVSRRAIALNAGDLLATAKNPVNQTMNLFDLIGGNQGDMLDSYDLHFPRYSYIDLIKEEASAIGLFVSGHPASNVGVLARQYSPTTISEMKSKAGMGAQNVLATFTLIDSKTKKNGSRSIAVRVDDGTSIFDCYLPKDVVQRIEKGREIKRIKTDREKGKNPEVGEKSKNPQDMIDIYYNTSIIPIEELEIADLYRIKITQRRRGDSIVLSITDIEKIETAEDGSIPYEIYFPNGLSRDKLDNFLKKHPGRTSIKLYLTKDIYEIIPLKVKITKQFIVELEKLVGSQNILTKGI